MSVKLTTRENGDVTIVDTSGKLTLGEGTSTLRTKIRELVAGGSRRIILNLANVIYMDSSGLGELIGAHTTVATAGGEMKLLNLAGHVHDLLKSPNYTPSSRHLRMKPRPSPASATLKPSKPPEPERGYRRTLVGNQWWRPYEKIYLNRCTWSGQDGHYPATGT